MKKIMVLLVALLVTPALFAEAPDRQGKPIHRGFFGLDWKPGTSMTAEYKKISGTFVLGDNLRLGFKAGGTEYRILLPQEAKKKLRIKGGSSVELEGIGVSVISPDKSVGPVFMPFKAVIDGKEIDLKADLKKWKRHFQVRFQNHRFQGHPQRNGTKPGR